MSVNEAEEIVELANRYGVKLTVVHSWLFSYIMKRVIKCLRSGLTGEIASVEITMLHTNDDPMASDPSHWCHKTANISFNAPRPETTLNIIGSKGIIHANLSNNILIKKQYREIRPRHIIIDNLKTISDVVTSSIATSSVILTRRYRGMHTEFIKRNAYKQSWGRIIICLMV